MTQNFVWSRPPPPEENIKPAVKEPVKEKVKRKPRKKAVKKQPLTDD